MSERSFWTGLKRGMAGRCPECGKGTFSKQVTAAGFQLKGTGWYATDFKNNGKQKSSSSDSGKGGDSGSSSDSGGKAEAAACGAGACPACS